MERQTKQPHNYTRKKDLKRYTLTNTLETVPLKHSFTIKNNNNAFKRTPSFISKYNIDNISMTQKSIMEKEEISLKQNTNISRQKLPSKKKALEFVISKRSSDSKEKILSISSKHNINTIFAHKLEKKESGSKLMNKKVIYTVDNTIVEPENKTINRCNHSQNKSECILKNIESAGFIKHHFKLKGNNIETKHAVSLLYRNTVDHISDKRTDSKGKRKICNKQASPLSHSIGRNRSRSQSNHRNRCSSITFHSSPKRKFTSPIDIQYINNNNSSINQQQSN